MAYTFLKFAEDTLAKAEYPLTYQEVWNLGCKLGLDQKLRSNGKTPNATLGSHLYREIGNKPDTSKFIKAGDQPIRFFLRSRRTEITDDFEAVAEEKAAAEAPKYKERDLHPLLAEFVANSLLFHGPKTIHTKTILHETSKKSGYGGWLHPDMVGVYLPIGDWKDEVLAFGKASHQTVATLFSFELKVRLDKNNYRECFFQAVSNSSWAHEGYLVTSQLNETDELNEELARLSASFGIGLILLDINDVNDSRVVLPATVKTDLDWQTMNKLCDYNPDFATFLRNVTADMNGGRINTSDYDKGVERLKLI